jgi:hypothetical protein
MKLYIIWFVGAIFCSMHFGCCSVRLVDGHGHAIHACNGACGVGVKERLHHHWDKARCNSGCGEVYWDEQINEPPVCDPCGCDGEFTGWSDCGRCPGALHRLRQLWGFHSYHGNCSHSLSHCDSCGQVTDQSESCTSCSGVHGATVSSEESSQPTPMHEHSKPTTESLDPEMRSVPAAKSPTPQYPKEIRSVPAQTTSVRLKPRTATR